MKTKEHDKPVFIKCGCVIICGGPWSGKVAELAGIGSDENHPEPTLRHKVLQKEITEAFVLKSCCFGPGTQAQRNLCDYVVIYVADVASFE